MKFNCNVLYHSEGIVVAYQRKIILSILSNDDQHMFITIGTEPSIAILSLHWYKLPGYIEVFT